MIELMVITVAFCAAILILTYGLAITYSKVRSAEKDLTRLIDHTNKLHRDLLVGMAAVKFPDATPEQIEAAKKGDASLRVLLVTKPMLDGTAAVLRNSMLAPTHAPRVPRRRNR